MRIGELSRRTDVSVATIKYYIRERLLPPGERTSANQATYDESHVRRLRLIRGLIEIAGVGIADLRELTTVLDRAEGGVAALEVAQRLATPRGPEGPASAASTKRVLALLTDRADSDPGLDEETARVVGHALDLYAEMGMSVEDDWLRRYLAAAAELAAADLDVTDSRGSADERAQTAALGTLLGDVVLLAFHRRGQAIESFRRYGRDPGSPHPDTPPDLPSDSPRSTP